MSALIGLVVGMGAPTLTTQIAGRAARDKDQRAVADRLLSLFDQSSSIVDTLRNDLNNTRRSLLLIGSRLTDEPSRQSIYRLIGLATSDPPVSDEVLLDEWTDFVGFVSHVYRKGRW